MFLFHSNVFGAKADKYNKEFIEEVTIMKIESGSVSMSSSHVLVSTKKETESLKVWSDNKSAEKTLNAQMNQLDIDKDTKTEVIKNATTSPQASDQTDGNTMFAINEHDKMKIKLIEAFMSSLTGKKFHIKLPTEITVHSGASEQTVSMQQPQQQRAGWGLIYNRSAEITESESTSFQATASIVTQDGKSISLNISMSMQREKTQSQSVSVLAGDALIDPLVMNFDSTAVNLSDQKVSFDLNSDGTEEQITFLAKGSGFLSLDRNKNGIIDDGTELFGTQSGDGFRDLAKYDQDGNGWIDENDDIFDQLQIWTKDGNGNDYLVGLAAKGVGAIYLGSAATEFSMNNMGALDAQIRRTGFFLNENGTSGTIQHVDFAI